MQPPHTSLQSMSLCSISLRYVLHYFNPYFAKSDVGACSYHMLLLM